MRVLPLNPMPKKMKCALRIPRRIMKDLPLNPGSKKKNRTLRIPRRIMRVLPLNPMPKKIQCPPVLVRQKSSPRSNTNLSVEMLLSCSVSCVNNEQFCFPNDDYWVQRTVYDEILMIAIGVCGLRLFANISGRRDVNNMHETHLVGFTIQSSFTTWEIEWHMWKKEGRFAGSMPPVSSLVPRSPSWVWCTPPLSCFYSVWW